MTLYRAADTPEIHEGDCLTDEIDVAREYATQRGYEHVYRVVVSESGDWADASDLDRAATAIYGDDRAFAGCYEGAGHSYADADQRDVRAALLAASYVAVQYDEPWGRTSAWTLRILDRAIVLSVEEVA